MELYKIPKSKIIFKILICFIIASCENNTYTIKKMKYERNGEKLSCKAIYLKDKIDYIYCFSKNQDTILKEDYKNGLRHGKSVLFYESGKIKEEAYFSNGLEQGISKEYHENGSLKSYRYYEIKNERSFLIYEKNYNINDSIISVRMPLKFWTIPSKPYKVGEKYKLYVEMIYSEFEFVGSIAAFNPSYGSGIKLDTFVFEGKRIFTEFTPRKVGEQRISGTIWEMNAKNPQPEYKIASKEWVFEYIAEK
jgi:MORN repeat variant